jgi:excisionase family DNA binding protein
MKQNKFLNNKEVALYLRATPKTLQNYRDKNLIPFYRIGKKIFYRKEEIDQALRNSSSN